MAASEVRTVTRREVSEQAMFENLSGIGNLEFLVGDSAEDLKKQLLALRLPSRILTIYAQGSRHYAWIQTSFKLRKKGI